MPPMKAGVTSYGSSFAVGVEHLPVANVIC